MILIEEFNLYQTLKLYFLIRRNKNVKKIYFIYSPKSIINKFLFYILKFYFKLINIKFYKLEFKMIDIRDRNNNFSRTKILDDMFNLEDYYLKKNLNESIFLNNKFLRQYIIKRVFGEEITHNRYGLTRTLFLMHVINYFGFKQKIFFKYFILVDRPFKSILFKYSNDLINTKLIFSYKNLFSFILLIRLKILKNIYKKYLFNTNFHKNPANTINEIKIYCEGEDHPNLEDNGERSDFFWLIGSSFPKKNVISNCRNINDYKYLQNSEIVASLNFSKFDIDYSKKINFSKSHYNLYDYTNLTNFIQDYNYLRNKYKNYFIKNNIKVSFCWQKYTSDHIIISEVLNEIGGISSIWQMSFEGFPQFESRAFADINFIYSNFSNYLEKKHKSLFKYQIITGYPISYVNKNILKKAQDLRNSLFKNGVEKVVCVLDENSYSNERWQTGHKLQIDNYEKILMECLKNKKLGVIFKPKVAMTLKKRLGNTHKLLEEAISTKRCFVYGYNDYSPIMKKNKYSPILAALSSDLVIHGHLSAGTAAIECALENIPTILIDREKIYNSKLRELPKNKIYFESWDEAIYSMNNHFFKSNDNEFGNWKKYLNVFDPFNDNKGPLRIREYLHETLNLFQKGEKKQNILEISANSYKKKWGNDKIIYFD